MYIFIEIVYFFETFVHRKPPYNIRRASWGIPQDALRIIGIVAVLGIVIFCAKDTTFHLLLVPGDSEFWTYRTIEQLASNAGTLFGCRGSVRLCVVHVGRVDGLGVPICFTISSMVTCLIWSFYSLNQTLAASFLQIQISSHDKHPCSWLCSSRY